MNILTFLHSGDMGDIVASLPTVKSLCEKSNAKAIMFLDTSGGMHNGLKTDAIIEKQTNGRGQKFNDKCFDFLAPLLSAQPYIDKCKKYNGEKVDYNLNEFRYGFYDAKSIKKHYTNLMYMHQYAFGLPMKYDDEPFLFVEPKEMENKRKSIMIRSTRYHSSDAYLGEVMGVYSKATNFIGTDLEYDCLKDEFGVVPPRVEVKNALEMAEYIAGAKGVFANGTLGYWIAVGLGKKIVHELGLDVWTTYFPDSTKISYLRGAKLLTIKQGKN